MTYQVVLKEVVGGEVNGKPFNVKRYYVTWFGREPKDEDPYLEVWADGSMTAVWKFRGGENLGSQRLWLYDDQWVGMILALQQAKLDKQRERRESAERWLAENGDKVEHYSSKVSLSINEAKRVLAAAPMRWNEDSPEVRHDGKWLHLCRTDLSDDVCTFSDHPSELEELRKHYLARIKFGARTDKERFAVVDAFSDG